MFWKVYFWSYVLLSLVGAYAYSNYFLTIGNALGIFLTLFVGMGVYSHAFSHHFFSKQVWLLLFYFVVASLGLEVVYYLTDVEILSSFLVSKYIIGVADWALTSILLAPALLSLWMLGNRPHPTKSKKK